MGYVIMCIHDQEIDPFANFFLQIASRPAKFMKFKSFENYALYGS